MSEQRLGQYQLHEKIGRGGFAAVFRATHVTLQNEVAVKVIDPGRAGDKDTRERLIREAQTASRLDHPHIVRVLDMDEDQGQVFIVMEYVKGFDLGQWLARNPQAHWRKRLAILGQIAAALDYAHQQSLLHRDVKPSNILIDEKGNARLTDFGLVKVAAAPHLTRMGSVVGTAIYMSPEQAEDKPLDGRSDQYSLGIAAYELLVGQPPFRSESSSPALLIKHIQETPPRPSAENDLIPPEVDDVLLKALQKKPAERYASCSEFVRALEAAYNTSESRRYRELLTEGRALTVSGQYAQAQAKLEAAAALFTDRPDLGEALAELEKTRLNAELYNQAVRNWQLAQQQGQNVLDLFPGYPDPQGLFVTLGLRQPRRTFPPWRELFLQVGIGLGVGGGAAAILWYLAFLWITRP